MIISFLFFKIYPEFHLQALSSVDLRLLHLGLHLRLHHLLLRHHLRTLLVLPAHRRNIIVRVLAHGSLRLPTVVHILHLNLRTLRHPLWHLLKRGARVVDHNHCGSSLRHQGPHASQWIEHLWVVRAQMEVSPAGVLGPPDISAREVVVRRLQKDLKTFGLAHGVADEDDQPEA